MATDQDKSRIEPLNINANNATTLNSENQRREAIVKYFMLIS